MRRAQKKCEGLYHDNHIIFYVVTSIQEEHIISISRVECNTFLQIIRYHLQDYAAQQPRKPLSLFSSK